MDRRKDIVDYLPPVLREVDEIKAINAVENEIIKGEWLLTGEQLDNQFVVTTNEDGISRYEKMLKLKVADTDTLETRVFKVLARYQEQAPYTWRVMKNIMDSLLGEGRYVMERDIIDKNLSVKLELTVGRQFDVVSELLERVTPQNMTLSIELRYNTWNKVKTKTWGELKELTWHDIKEEVI